MTGRGDAMRSSRWMLVVAALATAACRGDSPPVDADRDGVGTGSDCDDSNAAVHTAVTAYPDADGDQVGAGAARSFCTNGSLPTGFAIEGTDCAPGDATRWSTVADPPVDRDGDGHTAREGMPLCIGAVLPDPYVAAARGIDCDDAGALLYRWVTLYRDEDGDGIGARPRSAPWTCAGESLPAGFSAMGYDVDDADPTVTADPAADEGLALILD